MGHNVLDDDLGESPSGPYPSERVERWSDHVDMEASVHSVSVFDTLSNAESQHILRESIANAVGGIAHPNSAKDKAPARRNTAYKRENMKPSGPPPRAPSSSGLSAALGQLPEGQSAAFHSYSEAQNMQDLPPHPDEIARQRFAQTAPPAIVMPQPQQMPQMQPMQPMGMRGGYPQQQHRGRGAYGARAGRGARGAYGRGRGGVQMARGRGSGRGGRMVASYPAQNPMMGGQMGMGWQQQQHMQMQRPPQQQGFYGGAQPRPQMGVGMGMGMGPAGPQPAMQQMNAVYGTGGIQSYPAPQQQRMVPGRGRGGRRPRGRGGGRGRGRGRGGMQHGYAQVQQQGGYPPVQQQQHASYGGANYYG